MTMKTEVAKLFSSLGFEIDMQPLEKFENLTKGLRLSTANLARNMGNISRSVSDANSRLKTFNKNHQALAGSRSLSSLSKNYASMTKNVNTTISSYNRLMPLLNQINPKMVEHESRVFALVRAWGMLHTRIKSVNDELRVNRGLGAGSGRPPNSGAGGGRGIPSGGGRAASGGMFGAAAGGFLGNFSPAAAIAGGAVTAGFVVKKTVELGREWIKMKNVLTASTADAQQFNEALAFTEKTTSRLGTNVTEFGMAYAKILQASKGKLNTKQTEEIFNNFSELAVVLGSNTDDQKGIFRAISQMFSKGKIQMEEINQMAERQVPALAMLTRAYKELGMTQAEFEKAQQKGQLDPTKFIPLMAKYAKEYASNQGALDKALQGSVAQQGIFMNKLTKMAGTIMESGLDKLLGDMFRGLSKLVDILQPLAIWLVQVANGLIIFGKGLKYAAETSNASAAAITSLGLALLAIAFRSKIALASIWIFTGGTAAAFAVLRTALLRTGIGAIIVGIGFALASLAKHMSGEKSFVTILITELELLGNHLEIAKTRFKMFMSGIDADFEESNWYKVLKNVGHFATPLPLRAANAIRESAMEETDAAQSKASQPAIPTPPVSPWGNSTIHINNNLNMNGKPVSNHQAPPTILKLNTGGLQPK